MSCDCDCSVRVWLCGVQHVIGPDEDGRLNLTLDPVIVDYTGESPLVATAAPVVDVDPGKLEVVKYARNDLGRVTHVAVCGTWVPVSSPTSVIDPGPTADHVCYPNMTSWVYPQPFAAGLGAWPVAGSDRMAPDTCANQPLSLCIGDAQRADNYGSAYGTPVPDLSAAPWAPYPTGEGCGGAIRSDTVAPARDQRDSVRLLPDYPVGFVHDDSPVTLTFFFPRKAGSVGVGLWDPVNDLMVPLTSHTKPSGAAAIQHPDHLQMDTGNGTPVGNWSASFVLDPGSDLSDCEIVVWSINNGNAPSEDLEQIRLQVSGADSGACFEWATIGEVADWMTRRDPYGNVWTVDGTSICSDMEVGQGATYGNINGTVNGRTPTVA